MSKVIAPGVRMSEPKKLMEEVKNIDEETTILHSRTPYEHNYNSKHRLISTFLDANVKNKADYIPIHFSRLPDYFDQIDIDLAVMQVAYDEEKGYSFGTNPDYNKYFLQADEIWVEVNKQMPWTYGPELPEEKIDKKIEVDYKLPEYSYSISEEGKEVFNKISSYISQFIKEGSTLQVGVGKLQSFLELDKKVSVYSEMIGDWVIDINADNITGGFGMGTQKFYEWLDHNEQVELKPIAMLNDPCNFSKFDEFVSVNSAVEMDLFGQAASESIAYEQISGTGGSNDFTAGAAIAENGVSIIAMPSTTSDGKSKIVPKLDNIVTIPRADIDYVITEYGIAQMRFNTIEQRQQELIQIAHPKHREKLNKNKPNF